MFSFRKKKYECTEKEIEKYKELQADFISFIAVVKKKTDWPAPLVCNILRGHWEDDKAEEGKLNADI